MINSIILLLRPQQWMKNTFVFLPLFFDRRLFEIDCILPTLYAFFSFCFAASGIYCLNDIIDVDSDRKHSQKCKRPVASGAISISRAMDIMKMCFSLSIVFLLLLPSDVLWKATSIIGFYIVMNIFYCIKLKQKAIVDVFIIATGFVLRILRVGFSSGILLSHWIIVMTFLLALFLAFAKRRDDVVMYEETGVQARKNINRYNLDFMNQVITVIACLTMVSYILYTVSPDVIARIGSPYLYITSVFVLAGLIRYLQITIVDVKSGSPTKVLMHDRFVQSCIVGWILTFFIILYVK